MSITEKEKDLTYCYGCEGYTLNPKDIKIHYLAICKCAGCSGSVECLELGGIIIQEWAYRKPFQEEDIGKPVYCDCEDCSWDFNDEEETLLKENFIKENGNITHKQRTGQDLVVAEYQGILCPECESFREVRKVIEK